MSISKKQSALTLIEILVTLAVIAILVTITVGVSTTINTKAKTQLAQETIGMLVSAIEKYHDFWNEFPLIDKAVDDDLIKLDFAWDESTDNQSLVNRLGITSSVPADHEDDYASIEGVYYCLNRTPDCRKILEKINSSLVTADGTDNQPMTMEIDRNGDIKTYDLFRITDPWKRPLRYTYDKDADSFPLIESAGPDKIFGDGTGVGDGEDESYSEDNITNR